VGAGGGAGWGGGGFGGGGGGYFDSSSASGAGGGGYAESPSFNITGERGIDDIPPGITDDNYVYPAGYGGTNNIDGKDGYVYLTYDRLI
jgi:hypothetical protein